MSINQGNIKSFNSELSALGVDQKSILHQDLKPAFSSNLLEYYFSKLRFIFQKLIIYMDLKHL